jgi:hypothetical protein
MRERWQIAYYTKPTWNPPLSQTTLLRVPGNAVSGALHIERQQARGTIVDMLRVPEST